MSIVLLTIIIIVFLLSRWVKADEFFLNKYVAFWTIPFLAVAIYSIINSDWHKELIYTYETLFYALSNSLNPYTSNVIYHRLSDGSVIFSTFNYLPGEIIPYYIAFILFRSWNFGIMLIVNLFINLIVTLVFIFHLPQINRSTKILYSFLLLFTSLTHSASLVFFLIMISSLLLVNQKENLKVKYRVALVILMGVGTVAKFFMLPFIFLYFWNNIIERKKRSYFADCIGTCSIFLLFTYPFGVWEVVYSTILFNLNLTQRAQVTTYYFNIVSGFCYYTHLQILYGILVGILFLLTIILTRNIPFHRRILYVSLIALIIFPTPEDQFLGSLFGLLLVSKLKELLNLKEIKNNIEKLRPTKVIIVP